MGALSHGAFYCYRFFITQVVYNQKQLKLDNFVLRFSCSCDGAACSQKSGLLRLVHYSHCFLAFRSPSRVTRVSRTEFGHMQILFNVNYITLNNRVTWWTVLSSLQKRCRCELWQSPPQGATVTLRTPYNTQPNVQPPQTWLILIRKLTPLFARKEPGLTKQNGLKFFWDIYAKKLFL
jgi:hypothetical protein